MAELVLVRHGETVGESSVRLWGSTDVALSELGAAQMHQAGRALRADRFDRVVVSPLSRSLRSAELLLAASRQPAVPVVTVEAFREIDFGEWEGLTHEEAAMRDPELHRRWRRSDRQFRFPRGESRAQFDARVSASVVEAFEGPLQLDERRVLGVLHKGVIKVVLARLLALGFDDYHAMPVDLGGIHRLVGRPGAWELVTRNDTAHLAAGL